jgi:hypothetical protein
MLTAYAGPVWEAQPAISLTFVVRQQAKVASSSDEESEYEEYTEEEEDDDEGPMLKPVFVRASDRVTIKEKYALGRSGGSGARLSAWGRLQWLPVYSGLPWFSQQPL